MTEKQLRGAVGMAWLFLMAAACTEAPGSGLPREPVEAVSTRAGELGLPPDPVLEKDVPFTGISRVRGSKFYIQAEVPEGVRDLRFTITGGTGDADLYVRLDSAPTTTVYDCRPYKNGNEEECVFAAPAQGRWWVMLNAFTTFSGVTLKMTWKGGFSPLEPGVEVSGLSGGPSETHGFVVQIPEREDGGERNIHVRLLGAGNADLYVRRAALPSRSDYDCRSMNEHSTENCNLNGFAPGRYYVEVFGAKEGYSDGSLIVTYD